MPCHLKDYCVGLAYSKPFEYTWWIHEYSSTRMIEYWKRNSQYFRYQCPWFSFCILIHKYDRIRRCVCVDSCVPTACYAAKIKRNNTMCVDHRPQAQTETIAGYVQIWWNHTRLGYIFDVRIHAPTVLPSGTHGSKGTCRCLTVDQIKQMRKYLMLMEGFVLLPYEFCVK